MFCPKPMYSLAKQTQRLQRTSLSYYNHLITNCLSKKSLKHAKSVHGQLVKVGFNTHTFLGNRCLQLYSQLGTVNDVLKVFDDLRVKNVASWNVLLNGLLKFGHLSLACRVFDDMPERDVVSWNSMVSGFVSCGLVDSAYWVFEEMVSLGLRPSGHTYSIMLSVVDCARRGKEVHLSLIRSGFFSKNVVLGNSLIDMYGKFGLLDYAFGVFLTLEEVDVISWNSLITGCIKAGRGYLALDLFDIMRLLGRSPDEFTCSSIISLCSDLRYLEKGKQIFASCVKAGFLCNSIISSAVIDLFSKCNRFEDSVRLFEDLSLWDSPVYNSMISSFARHDLGDDAHRLFIISLKQDIRPTKFTLSAVISSIPNVNAQQGIHVHCFVVKSGLDSDAIVASSLVDMYGKFGLIDNAVKIFHNMVVRDLVSWNTMIMGLTQNGRSFEALQNFIALLKLGLRPNRITLAATLMACCYGGFVAEGIKIFSSMEEKHGIRPGIEHYSCFVDLLCQAGRLDEAIEITKAMPFEPNSAIWETILIGGATHGDLKLMEIAAERLMDLEPDSSLPYIVLSQAYGMRGQWEDIVRVGKATRRIGEEKIIDCSLIGIRDHVHTFRSDRLLHRSGKEIYSVLESANWEIGDEYYLCS